LKKTFDLYIAGEVIPVRVMGARGKRVNIRFSMEEAVLEVRIPGGKMTSEVQGFIQDKSTWILGNYRIRKSQSDRRSDFYERINQDQILYLDNWYPVEWYRTPALIAHFSDKTIKIGFPGTAHQSDRLAILRKGMRQLAKSYLTTLLWKWADRTQSHVNNVVVKSQKSKWGSCSTKRNINLNWHLVFLPESVIDYLIVHELMHLREMNHSPAYWKWVEHYYPNYKAVNSQLNDFSWLIGILDE